VWVWVWVCVCVCVGVGVGVGVGVCVCVGVCVGVCVCKMGGILRVGESRHTVATHSAESVRNVGPTPVAPVPVRYTPFSTSPGIVPSVSAVATTTSLS
jgi:hypothetical protein